MSLLQCDTIVASPGLLSELSGRDNCEVGRDAELGGRGVTPTSAIADNLLTASDDTISWKQMDFFF